MFLHLGGYMKNFTNYTVYDKKEGLHDETKLARGALGHDPVTGAISFPIFQSSTYRHIGIKIGFFRTVRKTKDGYNSYVRTVTCLRSPQPAKWRGQGARHLFHGNL